MTANEVRTEVQRVARTMSNDQVREAFVVAMQDSETRVAQWMVAEMVSRGMVQV